MLYFIVGYVAGGITAFLAFSALAMNSKIENMFRDDDKAGMCPPCNHHCEQGRKCPSMGK